ncbi:MULTISPECIES: efflux RND transporter permease subunit [Culturomica]|jgi:multidrug efflux pump|uniref:efflux RND transporter permease subunit n=1 Tax=Culturomica TaxID=1926651 RepID=UPI0003361072|nr:MULTISPECIES: efflux RND transporter permease subunit [Odoribacteraceae]RHV98628.1 AcrB/AcrD/AcrF family protein [Odoribacter sp. OF09-27XD]CCZ06629.1 hydrophobe/amphiphile efflux-1 (HAE1) family RND transporter [Odoribacter sp. CAG:788]HBO25872.1 AcrB/AcrD/AcrF family protein [Culturomica sp.]
MSLSSTCIKRPVFATVMNIILMLVGCVGMVFLGVRDYPSVDPPIISVSTSFPGANADVIETQITEPLEAAVNGIPGIRSLTSTSRDGRSYITVEFQLEVDLETAANDVRDKVSGAMRRLPKDVDPPTVTKADADAQPIFGVSLRSDQRSLIDLSMYAEQYYKERLQTINGVSSVSIWGEKRYSVRLRMNPALLAAYGVTPMDVRDAVSRENVELPSGRIEGENTELTIRTLGRLMTIEDFNNLVIRETDSKVVRFRDIGVAEVDAEDVRSIMKRNGIPMVACVIIPQPGANYIDIVDRAYDVMQDLEKDLPADVEAGIAFDNTVFIRNSIDEVKSTIVEAFILVVLIIFLFLRNWRTTLIPVLAIPISLVGAFFIMYLAGFTINILTLLAVVLAIGLVVDDAIVVMENIYTKIEQGMSPREAGFKGSEEIFFAVIATTVALVAVFFPIVFLQGTTGRLFREFSIVITGAVIISSFVALTFTPMISTKLLTRNVTDNWFYRKTEPFFNGLTEYYRRWLDSFMRRRFLAPVILSVTAVVIYFLWTVTPSEMAPLEDRSNIRVMSTAPEGATFDYMNRYTTELSSYVEQEVPEQDMIIEMIGGGNTNRSTLNLWLVKPEQRERTQQEIADELGVKVRQFTGARTMVSQQQTFGGRRGGLPVEYVIQAKNLEDLKRVLPRFMEEVNKSPVFSVADLNLKFTKPELTINIDRDKAAVMGVSMQNIAQTLQLTMSEQRVGYFILNGKQYQILSQIDRENRNKPSDLQTIYVRNDKGDLIALDNLVTTSESSMPPQLYRYDRFVAATVSAGLARKKTLSQGLEEMDRIAQEVLDDNFKTTLSGSSKDFVESSSSLMFAFILALVFIYLVLAAQFESFRDPLIIMLTVPLALIGAMLSLWYFEQTMNIFSQIGIIMLIGLVSKNGILIVEFANQRKAMGESMLEAVKNAAVARFRPILMTSLSTVLGILPMAIATGAGAESRVAMGIAVVGGMVCATFLSLFVIPAIYSYLSAGKMQVVDEGKE